jgi:hypothetical protein
MSQEPYNPLRWLEDIASELNQIKRELVEFNRMFREDGERIEKKLEALENEQ